MLRVDKRNYKTIGSVMRQKKKRLINLHKNSRMYLQISNERPPTRAKGFEERSGRLREAQNTWRWTHTKRAV